MQLIEFSAMVILEQLSWTVQRIHFCQSNDEKLLKADENSSNSKNQ